MQAPHKKFQNCVTVVQNKRLTASLFRAKLCVFFPPHKPHNKTQVFMTLAPLPSLSAIKLVTKFGSRMQSNCPKLHASVCSQGMFKASVVGMFRDPFEGGMKETHKHERSMDFPWYNSSQEHDTQRISNRNFE